MSKDYNSISSDWVDAHHHLWDLDNIHYPWLAARGERRFFGQPDAIRHNYLVNDFVADHQGLVQKSVHIQVGAARAEQLKETQFVEQMSQVTLAKLNNRYPSAAVVAVDMWADNIEASINAHLQHNIVRGVRDIIGKSPEENSSLPTFNSAKLLNNWKFLAENQLSFDLQLTSEQYAEVLATLEKVPELNVAICHLASPWDQTETGFNNWQQWMQKFAQLPNCYIKLSGFAMFRQQFIAADFRKYAHSAINIFGPDRCMFGSNFPVDKLYVSYSDLFAQWQEVVTCYNLEESMQLSAGTATHFYRLS
ncbi:amidohydrolase family protein [Thalassotalea fonticola]|uniref:Amidohydrolase family protein n=1 Tax=Thalassotalea fonticola TaxID=3065649 RepID=A0ABZ0GIT7_9GAMM|nr:amidohydrolase family protein [Colwelliaceae bacterium S1-1]